MTFIIGTFFIHETKDVRIHQEFGTQVGAATS